MAMDHAEIAPSDPRAERDCAAQLIAHLRAKSPPIAAIVRVLDTASHEARVAAIRSLGRAEQRALWEAADGFAPLSLNNMVAADVPPEREVRHFGKNTLPLYTRFEKRFCRPAALGSTCPRELHGYNFQKSDTAMLVSGPGYFIATEDATRGEVLVDYRRVPTRRPPGWPEIRENKGGVAGLVYGGEMVDTLRRVSEHVTIGRANKGGKDISAWFVLCREA